MGKVNSILPPWKKMLWETFPGGGGYPLAFYET